jgi:hypothetical protein
VSYLSCQHFEEEAQQAMNQRHYNQKIVSAAESKSIAHKTVLTLQGMRSDQCFDLFKKLSKR